MSDLWEGSSFYYRRSLASRVTVLTTLAVGLSVAFLAMGAYVTVRMQMTASLDESLLERAEAVSRTVNEAEVRGTEYNVPSWLLGAADVRLFVVSAQGSVYSADRGDTLPFSDHEFAVAAREQPRALRTIAHEGMRYRAATVPVGAGDTAIVLVESLEPQDRVLRRLGIVLLTFGAAGVVAAGLAGWAVARSGLRPVRRLTHAAEVIARTEDLRPLLVEGDDEIARLATAFNSMLLALSASRDRQRRLVADAGHELRTPLTSLRTNIDLLAQADAELTREQRAELLDDIRAQSEELTTLIGDLTELAREEPIQPHIEVVDLAEVVDRAVARVRLRAPGVCFDVHADPWTVRGESGALERAVTNLLDNAAKWSPPDGTVTVTFRDGVLTVADRGPGISEADLPHVFDRFYRSTESRSMPGSGLGLSIVRQVAERHGGAVTAGVAAGGGALLTMYVPGTPG